MLNALPNKTHCIYRPWDMHKQNTSLCPFKAAFISFHVYFVRLSILKFLSFILFSFLYFSCFCGIFVWLFLVFFLVVILISFFNFGFGGALPISGVAVDDFISWNPSPSGVTAAWRAVGCCLQRWTWKASLRIRLQVVPASRLKSPLRLSSGENAAFLAFGPKQRKKQGGFFFFSLFFALSQTGRGEEAEREGRNRKANFFLWK